MRRTQNYKIQNTLALQSKFPRKKIFILNEFVELSYYRCHSRSQNYVYHIGIRFVKNRGRLMLYVRFNFVLNSCLYDLWLNLHH